MVCTETCPKRNWICSNSPPANDDARSGMWIYVIRRDTLSPLTGEKNVTHPVWTPDGRYIVYQSPEGMSFARSRQWQPARASDREQGISISLRLLARWQNAGLLSSRSTGNRPLDCTGWTRRRKDEDHYDSQLLPVETATGAQRPLTNIRKGSDSPKWSPSGDRLAFLAEAGEKKAAEQIFVLPMNGGELQPVTSVPLGVEQFACAAEDCFVLDPIAGGLAGPDE